MKFIISFLFIQISTLFTNAQFEPEPLSCLSGIHMPLNGICQTVLCKDQIKCAQFHSYCQNGRGTEAFCQRGVNLCVCNEAQSDKGLARAEELRKSCNPTGFSACPTGQVCYPTGCRNAPTECALVGEKCIPGSRECCLNASGMKTLFCHKRTMGYIPESEATIDCAQNAHYGEDCTSGIPCEGNLKCIQGKCSIK